MELTIILDNAPRYEFLVQVIAAKVFNEYGELSLVIFNETKVVANSILEIYRDFKDCEIQITKIREVKND